MKILFFTDGSRCTPEDKALGQAMRAEFRNPDLCEGDEPCDYVFGAIPECYKDKPIYEPEAPPPVRTPKLRKCKAKPAVDVDAADG